MIGYYQKFIASLNFDFPTLIYLNSIPTKSFGFFLETYQNTKFWQYQNSAIKRNTKKGKGNENAKKKKQRKSKQRLKDYRSKSKLGKKGTSRYSQSLLITFNPTRVQDIQKCEEEDAV